MGDTSFEPTGDTLIGPTFCAGRGMWRGTGRSATTPQALYESSIRPGDDPIQTADVFAQGALYSADCQRS